MKVVVDMDLCEAHGVCVDLSPEVFALDDNDDLVLLMEFPREELRDSVVGAARGCPKAAITMVE